MTVGGPGSGGRREGAGRPVGSKTLLKQEARAIAAAQGKQMLDVLHMWAHDPQLPFEKRIKAIEIGLMYTLPKLAAQLTRIENDGEPLVFQISVDDSNL
jgi:hypothetical protein